MKTNQTTEDVLVCCGGRVPVPGDVLLVIPGRYGVLDVPVSEEYDDTQYVCRESAEDLARKYPSIFRIEQDRGESKEA